ncbi:acetamidase/formamidase family protein [Nocardioidaceae bacterium SCSIO 66511]|nr:acetamidase/formamidase family protein [Nocardioidaceae bacterium SCSIO 66511]
MAEHFIAKSESATGFSADRDPARRVVAGAGDRITFETDDAAYAEMADVLDLAKLTSPLNPITGPVYVEGASVGDALAVTIHDVDLAPHGWSVYLPGAGALSPIMGDDMIVRRIPIDSDGVHLSDTLVVAPAPMIGCIGVAPSSGEASTVMPSYPTGGNMDLTDARPGTTVYLPVQVEGALLSIGDIHAVMSRGESSFVAIEAAGRATVSVDVLPAAGIDLPFLDTGEELVFVGLGDPVHESVRTAYEAAFHHLVDGKGWEPMDAYVAMSAVAHTELGGPTGSADPDPLHPLRPVGAVTLTRIAKRYV